MKAKLGSKKVRPWKWMPFTNPARKDGAMFFHWRRAAEEGKDYPFARFNKVSYHHSDRPVLATCSVPLAGAFQSPSIDSRDLLKPSHGYLLSP